MVEKRMNMEQGHWVLAKLGKKVLRPGGQELTHEMLKAMNITSDDDVIEFAPGLGYTAKLALSHQPHSYVAVELNAEAAKRVENNVQNDKMQIAIGNASETGLPANSASKVYGEAMLTMQSKPQKQAIIAEAARLLRPGGLYGIHEIGIYPDNTSQEVRKEIESDLAKGIKTNVRPLTLVEWKDILEDNGFDISYVERAKSIFIGLVLLLISCEKESFLSDDYARYKELLPNKKEYVDDDLGTQALAKAIEGHYSSKLSMIYYDAERIKPLLYFTAGKHQVHCTTNANGSLHLSINKFHTNFMPLYVSVEMDVLLSEGVGDTIRLQGRDGIVRTSDEGKQIGLELPESDDAELEGYFLRSKNEVSALIDLMLPVAMKMQWQGTK